MVSEAEREREDEKKMATAMVVAWNLPLGVPVEIVGAVSSVADYDIGGWRGRWWASAEWVIDGVSVAVSETRVYGQGSTFSGFVRMNELDECTAQADSAHEALCLVVAAAREACANEDVDAGALEGVIAMIKGVAWWTT